MFAIHTMKGISHFITGVASASFFPWSVQAAVDGNPLYFIIGGAFGLLPDTLDFKLYRFFYKHDLYVDPDPAAPDPQAIADQLADALATAYHEKREFRMKLNTIKLSADMWRQYEVRFDDQAKEVVVRFGPAVNTGQVPAPGSEYEDLPVGRAPITVPFHHTYDAVTTIDIFDGPSFAAEPDKNGVVNLYFLPWHRTWSHSLLTGCAFGILGALLWGWQAGIIIPVAFAAHVLEDQYGHMGSNLFWPITRKRFQGLGRMHAGDAIPNFLCVWLCCLLIFWNCYRVMETPLREFTLGEVLLYAGVIPIGLFGLLHRLVKAKIRSPGDADASDEWIESMPG